MLKINMRFLQIGVLLMIAVALLLAPVSVVFAKGGQPNASCEDVGVTPGNAVSAPGSAFNPDGQAGSVYAGEQPQNSGNPKSVSQYDVACLKVSQH
jgi:hypothetical protein